MWPLAAMFTDCTLFLRAPLDLATVRYLVGWGRDQ